MATNASSSSLSSLPRDLLFHILDRVPKRSYPILSCVSNKFRDLLRSREFHIFRRKQGKDSLYICFTGQPNSLFGWYTLRRNETNPIENLFTPTNFPCIHGSTILNPIAIGPEIFVVSLGTGVQIYDSRSELLSDAPVIPRADQVYFTFNGVGSVGNKVYVFGTRVTDRDLEKIVEVFDTNIRGWQSAPDVKDHRFMTMKHFIHAKETDKKICVLRSIGVTSYNPKDGSCDSSIHMPRKWKSGACVIDNILFAYVSDLGGLMWYDSPLNEWKVVDGLNLNLNDKPVEMGEYYGELALLWMESDAICCTFIALERSESGFSGTAEPNKQLGILPSGAKLAHCLSVLV